VGSAVNSSMSATLDHLRAALPPEGLFAGKNFLLSPEPLRLEPALVDELETLGHRLQLFQRAANELYHRAHRGKAPAWVAGYVDGGKPAELLEFARQPQFYSDLPGVIRPDLLLTPGAPGPRGSAFAITELDSVPGGIGLTAWLSLTYAALGHDVLGGPYGMIRGFHQLLGDRADILVSDEAGTYRPEMEWAARIARSGEWRAESDGLHSGNAPADWQVVRAEDYLPPALAPGEAPRSIYRFFEQFDLPNLPNVRALMDAATAGRARITPPFKPWLEEKLWLALFWSRPLHAFWRRELSDRHFRVLQKYIPFSWVMDPTPLPHHAVIPGLEINDWRELAAFSQKQRELVLKVSGFSPEAWGSRGVVVGSDVPQHEWSSAVNAALTEFSVKPRVLMRFAQTKIIEHPYYDRETGEVRTMRGRVRLCPYYFVKDGKATLGGALATIVPADKKIVHGMTDAILVPAAAG
jgi:hypothetical protein